jgi:hypothetical protein
LIVSTAGYPALYLLAGAAALGGVVLIRQVKGVA